MTDEPASKQWVKDIIQQLLVDIRRSNNQILAQNESMVRRLKQIADYRKHYLKHRLPFLKRREDYMVELDNLKALHKNMAAFMGHTKRIETARKPRTGESRYYVQLYDTEITRLERLLYSNFNDLPKPPRDKQMVYLSPYQIQKLHRVLNDRL